MIIRCQECRAVFSLQDGVALGAKSFAVECGRCGRIFQTAAPEKSPTPAPPAPPEGADPDSGERRATADELAFALDPPLPDRLSQPEGALPAGKESDRRRLKPVLLKPVLWAAVFAVLALAAYAITRSRLAFVPGSEKARMREARGKLLRDDLQSLQDAAGLFAKAARLSQDEAEPQGELAFALLLQAETHLALADHLEQRFLREGLAAAKAALGEDRDDPAALRALALHAALAGAREEGEGALERAARSSPSDPWTAYTRAALILAGPPSRESQEGALAALEQARKAEPRLLRAQVAAAAIAAARGGVAAARAQLGQVLKQNPRHERAQRLLASLPAR